MACEVLPFQFEINPDTICFWEGTISMKMNCINTRPPKYFTCEVLHRPITSGHPLFLTNGPLQFQWKLKQFASKSGPAKCFAYEILRQRLRDPMCFHWTEIETIRIKASTCPTPSPEVDEEPTIMEIIPPSHIHRTPGSFPIWHRIPHSAQATTAVWLLEVIEIEPPSPPATAGKTATYKQRRANVPTQQQRWKRQRRRSNNGAG